MNHVALVREYLDAYAKKDLDAIARLLDQDVTLQDWNIGVAGKEAVLEETRKNFESARSIEISIREIFESADGVAAQLSIVVNGSVALDVVDVLSFDAVGKITAIRAYKG
jgi:ketosteroid isomerase-like protein